MEATPARFRAGEEAVPGARPECDRDSRVGRLTLDSDVDGEFLGQLTSLRILMRRHRDFEPSSSPADQRRDGIAVQQQDFAHAPPVERGLNRLTEGLHFVERQLLSLTLRPRACHNPPSPRQHLIGEQSPWELSGALEVAERQHQAPRTQARKYLGSKVDASTIAMYCL